ncbi:hypothetical protein VIGAN_UM043700 [Vigna angularis var. angularis]|uniref:Uncharacterized protein n=1 Tax=Vigna angularis var. angularis TaxID=157739 RepID=A0A0S3TE37_PHAAN|nr:hypothetical protein VIGAN_UM043700 [Vigna angularis var. angularis]
MLCLPLLSKHFFSSCFLLHSCIHSLCLLLLAKSVKLFPCAPLLLKASLHFAAVILFQLIVGVSSSKLDCNQVAGSCEGWWMREGSTSQLFPDRTLLHHKEN